MYGAYSDNEHVGEEESYFITPSLSHYCPRNECLTLLDFIDSYNSSEISANISLFFLPGSHILDRELSLSHVNNLTISKSSESSDSVFIQCRNELGRVYVNDTTLVLIGGLHFIGCGHNTVTQVEELVIFDTTFQGVDGRGTALMLNAVIVATIIDSSFLSNSYILSNQYHDIDQYMGIQEGLECITLDSNASLSAGGAICIAFSNVTIISNTFMHNTAETGGALVAYQSNIHIAQSVYIRNRADIGGAIVTSESTVSINNSIFAANKADMYGGVMTSYNVSSIIRSVVFVYNKASICGGVMQVFESTFRITNSTFRENTAGECCGGILSLNSSFTVSTTNFMNNKAISGGVIFTLYEASYEIANCSFTNNSVSSVGGVIFSVDKPSFIIINTTFNDNRANNVGGVMYTLGETSVDVTNCSFFNNSANTAGGVVYALDDSSFSFTYSTFDSNSAGAGGAIAIFQNSPFSITQCTFVHNRAADYGGAILTTGEFEHSGTNTTVVHSGGGSSGNTYQDLSFIIRDCIFAHNSAGSGGGVIITFLNSKFTIANSTFAYNRAEIVGAVMYTLDVSSFKITDCSFVYNSVLNDGGVIYTVGTSSFHIIHSNFITNSAYFGGVALAFENSSLTITSSNFSSNRAEGFGGVVYTLNNATVNITNCVFTNNSAIAEGGVIYALHNSAFDIFTSTFAKNIADRGGVMSTYRKSAFKVTTCTFTNNHVADIGGVIDSTDGSTFNITDSTFTYNSASVDGGVVLTFNTSSLIITNCTFSNNNAFIGGGVIYTLQESSISITTSTFTNNSAAQFGGAILCSGKSLSIKNSLLESNHADTGFGGVVFATECSTHISNCTFRNNYGSLYPYNSNLTLSGYNRFENGEEPLVKRGYQFSQEGGGITAFQSTVIKTGVTHFINNRASQGGAILATDSTITLYGESVISNNMAINTAEGGGLSLRRSVLQIKGKCTISDNYAIRGGGIHASSSTVSVYQPGMLQLVNNSAENGSGMFLEVNTKLYILKYPPPYNSSQTLLKFEDNRADYGGAMYVRDDSNSGACSPNVECFVQTIALYSFLHDMIDTVNMKFNGNIATEQGSDLFGGLVDRCMPSPFSEVYVKQTTANRHAYSGLAYLKNISNIERDSIASLAVRVCLCNDRRPDCSYQPLVVIHVRKGEAFNVSLVAVDQVNHTVDAHIISSLSSSEGGFGEGQQIQKVGRNCTDLTFNVYSPHESETINLSADGPCGSSTLSTTKLNIQFLECTCPVGFEPRSTTKTTRCECVCDSALSPYITNCSYQTRSLIRLNTNSWISYSNTTSPAGYVVHSNCPFDYCNPPTDNVSMDLNLPDGADAQCAYNRRGLLCGACQKNYSLSLGTSSCLPCPTYWPVLFLAVVLAALIAGILLVVAVLALNLTVAVGLVNSFIFYANIVAAGNSVFFPSLQPSFPNVFVAWLNLDIGIDVCFINGLDAYTKVWLQLIFPVYIISLVILVIIVSEFSPRFSTMIGKRDPIATLATLILLSYAKLLSVTITALSFGRLDYPDGSREMVWLPDGNVKYFQGKHIPLFLVAMLITVIALPYTFLLFLWQWILRAPRWKIFKWTRNTKLNTFIAAYHVSYNKKYRYWTGLLLLVRVVLYITASVTASSNPQTFLLLAIILISGLVVLSKGVGVRVYNNTFVDTVDTVTYLNLLTFSAFSLYNFKADTIKQTVVAYTSTIVTSLLLIGAIAYHVILLMKDNKKILKQSSTSEPVQTRKAEVTHTEVEFLDHRYSQSESNDTQPHTMIEELTL